jgi:hypothetical protein
MTRRHLLASSFALGLAAPALTAAQTSGGAIDIGSRRELSSTAS